MFSDDDHEMEDTSYDVYGDGESAADSRQLGGGVDIQALATVDVGEASSYGSAWEASVVTEVVVAQQPYTGMVVGDDIEAFVPIRTMHGALGLR